MNANQIEKYALEIAYQFIMKDKWIVADMLDISDNEIDELQDDLMALQSGNLVQS